MSILIKNIILNNKKQDIFIEGNKIKKIGSKLNFKADEKIDGFNRKAVLPGLVNAHTHAAMTLFRGYGDDLPLKEWLENKIWPLEAKLTQDDIYWGTKLACLEMIKTGTTCFNDMYWGEEAVAMAAEEMGIRARAGFLMIDFNQKESRESCQKTFNNFHSKNFKTASFALAPHSIYAVSKENLIWAKNFAEKYDLILHIHISETEDEVKNCQKQWKMRPVEYLKKIGFLGENVVLAHGIWLSDKEIAILRKRKCSVAYNPCSNLKLAVGEILPYKKLERAGVNVCLGTDGAASNNNLDMFEEMKIGALLQKHKEKDPTLLPASQAIKLATLNGAGALHFNAGEIKEGKLADLILIDLNNHCFALGNNFVSDIVYCASGSCVSDAICNGKIIMRERSVDGEKEIIKKASLRARKLIK